MCSTLSTSTENWIVDSAFRSECTTTFAMFLWTNTSPGSSPVIWLAGTRLSEQPIHMYFGACCLVSDEKKPGRSRSICAAQARLWAKRSSRLDMDVYSRWSREIKYVRELTYAGRSHRLGEQLAADQHATDFAGARADLVELRVAPQAPQRVFVDVPVAAEDLDAFAGHPCRFLGAPQDDRSAILAHLAHVLGAEHVEVLAD